MVSFDRAEIVKIQENILTQTLKGVESGVAAKNFFHEFAGRLATLGETGKALEGIAEGLRIDHPELSSKMVTLPSWWAFSEAASGTWSHDGKFDDIVAKLRNLPPRLHKDVQRFRQKKTKMLSLDMKYSYVQGENQFYDRNLPWESYARNGVLRPREGVEDKIRLLQENKLDNLAAMYKRRQLPVSDIQRREGFGRLSPFDAAVVAANKMGLKYDERNFVRLPATQFTATKAMDDVMAKKAELVLPDWDFGEILEWSHVNFTPRLYPLHLFGTPPPRAMQVIECAETIMGGHPAFDYYWVVAPSADVYHHEWHDGDRWSIPNGDGTYSTYDDELKACLALDNFLIRENYIVPVILGEADGQNFFLCLWA